LLLADGPAFPIENRGKIKVPAVVTAVVLRKVRRLMVVFMFFILN
jgi:hypothetical protein